MEKYNKKKKRNWSLGIITGFPFICLHCGLASWLLVQVSVRSYPSSLAVFCVTRRAVWIKWLHFGLFLASIRAMHISEEFFQREAKRSGTEWEGERERESHGVMQLTINLSFLSLRMWGRKESRWEILLASGACSNTRTINSIISSEMERYAIGARVTGPPSHPPADIREPTSVTSSR